MKIFLFLLYFTTLNLILSYTFDILEKNIKKRSIVFGRHMMLKKVPIIYTVNGVNENIIQMALNLISKETCLNFYKVSKLSGNGLKFVRGTNCSLRLGMNYATSIHTFFVDLNCENINRIKKLVLFDLGIQQQNNKNNLYKYIQNQVSLNNKEFLPYIERTKFWSGLTFGIKFNNNLIRNVNLNEKNEINKLIRYIDIKMKNIYNYQSYMFNDIFNDIKFINNRYCYNRCSIKLNCFNGAYTDPNNCNNCKCTKFFYGKLCDKFVQSKDKKCGYGILKAMDKVRTIKVSNINNCFYKIEAKEKHKILINISIESKLKYSLCYNGNGIEIVHTKDKSKSGKIFCEKIKNTKLVSEDNIVLININDVLKIYNVVISYIQVKN
ncbi:Astacin-like metalloendopeptidase [Strongyloides ratti]|uniref:Astacin-like metalloendopeptidase n=1 Tax=Strongyloides ratti TaxID=34506 RepID=A0A090LJH9_STRRB|nr:Astacin-like metalloendopeptidase [Strongyloides ratti]CEF69863.1 Astacin-like metalloendopeptidase [Strongyloides ratti]